MNRILFRLAGRVIEVGRAAVETLAQASPSGKRRYWAWTWIGLVYLLGLLWFGIFLEWGKHGLFFHDWADITGPRWQFLRMAVLSGQLPLHISDPSTMHGFTVRYLSVPDTLISPQYVLLAGLSIPRFNLVNVWLLYTLGFGGLLLIQRKLRLSVLVFAGMAILTNFNGNLLAHYSVGHTSWGGTFLFPWFVWFVLKALDGNRSWKLILGMAATLTVIWLQGSFHQYLWLLILVALVGVFVPRTFWTMVKAGVAALLMSAVRLFPAVLLYGTYSASFDNGYPSVWALLDYLVRIADPLENRHFQTGLGVPIGAWELTSFIGLVGAVGTYLWCVPRAGEQGRAIPWAERSAGGDGSAHPGRGVWHAAQPAHSHHSGREDLVADDQRGAGVFDRLGG